MRCYLYHKTEAPMIINVDDMAQHVDWEESPIPFILTTDFGVDPNDEVKVQCLGESIMGVRDCCNGLLNLPLMTFKELREFADVHFKGVKARSKKALINKIEAKNDNSSRYH